MIYRNENIFHPNVEKCCYLRWGAWTMRLLVLASGAKLVNVAGGAFS